MFHSQNCTEFICCVSFIIIGKQEFFFCCSCCCCFCFEHIDAEEWVSRNRTILVCDESNEPIKKRMNQSKMHLCEMVNVDVCVHVEARGMVEFKKKKFFFSLFVCRFWDYYVVKMCLCKCCICLFVCFHASAVSGSRAWWILTCLLWLVFVVDVLPQMTHSNGRSPVWMRLCSFK